MLLSKIGNFRVAVLCIRPCCLAREDALPCFIPYLASILACAKEWNLLYHIKPAKQVCQLLCTRYCVHFLYISWYDRLHGYIYLNPNLCLSWFLLSKYSVDQTPLKHARLIWAQSPLTLFILFLFFVMPSWWLMRLTACLYTQDCDV